MVDCLVVETSLKFDSEKATSGLQGISSLKDRRLTIAMSVKRLE